jgi:uncharacterized membrane protein
LFFSADVRTALHAPVFASLASSSVASPNARANRSAASSASARVIDKGGENDVTSM